MDNNLLILEILHKVLGNSKKTARNNYAFSCPNNCHPTKPKLEVNLSTHKYQCWVCGGLDDGFRGNNLFSLLKKVKAPPEKFEELSQYVKGRPKNNPNTTFQEVELPKEFKNILGNTNLMAQHALAYLKSRRVTKDDIEKYGIGYCESGNYSNMIIIPSYDKDGKLNFFTGRSFEKEPYATYRNPDVSRNIIPFELFINWDIPLILCEGPFDAIAIKRNAIPLFGNNIQSNLMKKIVTSRVKKIYLALDVDAKKKAVRFAEYLINQNKEIYLLDIQDKDPSKMGFTRFTELIQNTPPLTQYDLIKIKLEL